MKSNKKHIPKIFRDISIAGLVGIIFLTGFYFIYSTKMDKDVARITEHIEKKEFKYVIQYIIYMTIN